MSSLMDVVSFTSLNTLYRQSESITCRFHIMRQVCEGYSNVAKVFNIFTLFVLALFYGVLDHLDSLDRLDT